MSSAIKTGWRKMFYDVNQNASLRKLPALCGSAVNMRSIHRRERENGKVSLDEFDLIMTTSKTVAFLCVTPYLCTSVLKNTTVSQLGKNIQLIF